jgi:hypothetical protein
VPRALVRRGSQHRSLREQPPRALTPIPTVLADSP